MLDRQDERRLCAALDTAERAIAEEFIADVFGVESRMIPLVTFDHVAVLVFPDDVNDVVEFCTAREYIVDEPFPSVVVRDRLARRYNISAQALDVTILRAHPQREDRRGIEVFILPRCSASAHVGLAAQERLTDAEAHLAWVVDPDNVEAAWRACRDELGMRPDGGGHNSNEDIAKGGRSVFYFQSPPGTAAATRIGRMELTTSGHHASLLAQHHSDTAALPDRHTSLLSVLAGHWAARAVHVAVEIGLPDVLDQESLPPRDIAERLGCDPAATSRLLRYLCRTGFVRQLADATYTNTEMGGMLLRDKPFGDLVRLYGGEFYDAWSEFESTVRTGRTAFLHHYGSEHFDHFASDHVSARTFDRAMQAVTEVIADELAKSYRFPVDARLVDIGGGNGTLVRAVLREHPTVRGVVFDRKHVSAHAKAEHRTKDRFLAVEGDFFVEVPAGGDVYVLSRVLHDWSDEDCEGILDKCRVACTVGTTMLVLERFLPELNEPPRHCELGTLWDLQMLAITGGRERERSEYEKLLISSGFRVDEVRPLPMDMNLLITTAC